MKLDDEESLDTVLSYAKDSEWHIILSLRGTTVPKQSQWDRGLPRTFQVLAMTKKGLSYAKGSE
jgi:hypothetical protein